MTTRRNVAKTGSSRVFLQEGGAGPSNAPQYMGHWKAGAVSWDFGESTSIEIPSVGQYNKFDVVGSVEGAQGKPSMPLTARYSRSLSEMLRMARRGCYNDAQVHIGECGNPSDFQGGWDKIVVLEGFRVSNYSTEDLGALSSDENAVVNETIATEGEDLFEILKLSFAEICAAAVIQEVLDVKIADDKSCGGECGDASDGCSKVFALVKAAGGSPGLGAQVVYSADGGSTCAATVITTLGADEDPDRMDAMSDKLVVVSAATESHHWADRDDVIAGTETWQEVSGGYVADHGPLDVFVLKGGYAWVVGEGGYVYFMDDPANPVTVLESGSATTEDLVAVHAYDEENVLCVGNNNAVIYSADGTTFTPVTGPAVGVNLSCCWMQSETTWWVGTEGGRLYYTENRGLTWTEKSFSGAGTGKVRDIVFHGKQVGYMAHDTATPAGRIFRTIDGGYSWYALPETAGSIPANDRINRLALCDDPNLVFGGGLADNGTDGIVVKASA